MGMAKTGQTVYLGLSALDRNITDGGCNSRNIFRQDFVTCFVDLVKDDERTRRGLFAFFAFFVGSAIVVGYN